MLNKRGYYENGTLYPGHCRFVYPDFPRPFPPAFRLLAAFHRLCGPESVAVRLYKVLPYGNHPGKNIQDPQRSLIPNSFSPEGVRRIYRGISLPEHSFRTSEAMSIILWESMGCPENFSWISR